MLATSATSGEELLAYQPGGVPAPHPDAPDMPLVFSCIVALHAGKVLFVFNRHRRSWELPAGMIEPGETPEAAGLRELREETSQIADSLTFVGTALMRVPRHGAMHLEPGAIFTCDLQALHSFAENDEIGGFVWWDVKSRIDQHIDEVSLWLIRAVMGSLPPGDG